MKTLKRLGVAVLLIGVLIVGAAAVSAQTGSGNPDGRGRGGGRLGTVVDGVQQDGWRGCIEARAGLRVRVEVLRLAAEQTGVTTREIVRQINDGATLGTVLADNGVDVDAFAAEATERAETRLNLLIANDRITQEEADDLLAQFQERLDEALSLTPAV